MKIQCDVCTKKEASIFCIADEASLCDSCDNRVHHANKLASKHQRFSLIHPSPSLSPLCDICQENRALVFCQEDRAILCRDCEVTLHSGNEHTQKHNRFLLTGIKLSAISDNSKNNNNQNQNQNQNQIPSSDCINGCHDQVPDYKTAKSKPSFEISQIKNNDINFDKDGSTSSISEYLIETLPGWHFEDFFHDSTSPAPFAFSKSGNKNNMERGEDMLSFLDVDLDKELSNSSQIENLGFRVPQAPQSRTQVLIPGNFGNENGLFINNYSQGRSEREVNVNYGMMNKVSRNWRKNDGFTVPHIYIHSVGSSKKRHRF